MMDKLKLVAAVLIVAIGVGAFYYLSDKPDLIRVLALLAAIAVAVAVALQSTPGKAAWEFAKESRQELRKVVWPARKETVQVTLVVFAMVVVIALFLWGVDWILLKGLQALTGQRA
ncbi:MAG: preprotein translocase subunit SecE [Pseudomonadota bacterium]|nr:MAG: preprotein translocase subunit SecE [Pseudomonadota bacterium]